MCILLRPLPRTVLSITKPVTREWGGGVSVDVQIPGGLTMTRLISQFTQVMFVHLVTPVLPMVIRRSQQ